MSDKVILLIEDDEDIREHLAKLIEFEGYQVETAANGRLGIQKLLEMEDLPCLILLDAMMPVLDGQGFLKALRAESPDILESIPILLFSAGLRIEDPAIRGAVDKPIDIPKLMDLIAHHCGA